MRLRVEREIFTEKCTIGRLFVDDKFECYTLEDRVRPVKIPRITAIPMGTYRVEVSQSGRFKRLMPQLMDVPNFEGVRIHSGNTAEDTEGCILVGRMKGEDLISKSRLAFEDLFKKIHGAWKRKETITIEIHHGTPSGLDDISRALRNICLPDVRAVRTWLIKNWIEHRHFPTGRE